MIFPRSRLSRQLLGVSHLSGGRRWVGAFSPEVDAATAAELRSKICRRSEFLGSPPPRCFQFLACFDRFPGQAPGEGGEADRSLSAAGIMYSIQHCERDNLENLTAESLPGVRAVLRHATRARAVTML